MNSGEDLKKNANPRQHANFFNIATFFYTFPLFFKGSKQELEESDLYDPLKSHKSSRLGNKIEKAWENEVESSAKRKSSPSLSRVLIKLFAFEYFKFGIIHLLSDIVIKITQSLCLAKLIEFYTPGQVYISQTGAYLYAGGVAGCSLLVVLLIHPTIMEELHVGMKIRVACCSLLYRKSLKLNTSAYQETTVGQIVNLLSNDVNRFDLIPAFLHYIWIGPLQTGVSLYFMYQSVGMPAVYGIIFILLFIPLEILLAKIAAKLRLKTAIRTDERVRLMNEIILGIQVIKMYTWEKPFDKFVAIARKLEIDVVLAGSYVKAIYSSFIMFTSRTALFVTIIIYVLPHGNTINAQQVFLLTAFYNIIRHSMTILFPQGLAVLAETKISINRLTNFLMYSEQVPAIKGDNGLNEADGSKKGNDDNVVVIENGNAKWIETQNEHIFHDINVKITRGQLIAIIGPVGSGKSSIFHVILNELPLLKGRVSVNGKISYASQEPWLFSNNVRQNILFGDEMDKHHYRTVVNRCALEEDFRLFPYGDKTMVGERGISLSGGQRARINLARAVYKEADLYLLDDPLSAVDTHVGKHIFEKCIKEYLHNKTVILITHQLQYLKEVDRIIIVEHGAIKAEGTYSELTSLGLDFTKLLKLETELNQEDEITKKKVSISKADFARSISVASETFDSVGPKAQTEQKSEGAISANVYKSYIGAGGNCCVLFVIFFLLVGAQITASLSDYFITFWVNLIQDRDANSATTRGRGQVLPSSFNRNYSVPKYVELRAIDEDSFLNFSDETAIYIYLGLTIAVIVLSLSRSMTFFKVCMASSIKLHRQLFNSIIYSKMLFFNTNTSGRILNRFSKDMGNVDDRLPLVLVETLQIFLNVLAVVIMVIIINYWLAIPSLIIVIIFYFLRIFFLKTSRAVKRLEGTTRSPVFGHLGASLEGLPTIRAFGSQNKLQKEFDRYQDTHSAAWFSFISSAMAFGYWLDLICVAYIAIVTLTFVIMESGEYGGNVGLAITQSLSLTGMFQWGMKQSTELENQMTSVERVLEYINNIEPEPALESSIDKKPKPEWPDKGEIQFRNLSLKYSPDDPPVLNNLNFTIKPLEKVGIVGRTGAGKSSLIAALFRLAECEGIISIDDVNTGEIGLHDLRSKISIIPQEPVLFSGTLRKNLDPFDRYNDDILWKALEEVELKKAVTDSKDGLGMPMVEGGKNFSLGQRQLVCLARAIIQNNKILIMDEATANVDLQTDALIQNTIRRKFVDCSVLTIAHRLNTVIDSDKVLVMNAGKMVEFDHPYILLQNKDSYFYKMVSETGTSMTNVLTEQAAASYNKSLKIKSE